MGVKNFIESGYEFRFNSKWNVIKYDDHRFYKILSGHDMSGVDFAGIYNNELVYLIEIKNFNQFRNDGNEKSIDDFTKEIIEKGMDTIQLISVIKKYLNRMFWYKAMHSLVTKFNWINPEWYFWSKVHRLFILEKKGVFILLIDADYKMSMIKDKLRKALSDYYQDVIVMTIEEGNQVKGLEVVKLKD